ncbi:ATP-binding cassette domain-containing protein [Streptomyces sp. NPDC056296]|uniref:ATP-binding cassette domain-containing protein n=1 Tax=Streptomyces sp. NPDC056296 TaxID=3345775 RepID=UPI0035DC9575
MSCSARWPRTSCSDGPSRPAGMVTQRAPREHERPFAEELGIGELLSAPVSSLSPAEAQLVEIVKPLAREARVLLLDEPTAVLSRTASHTHRGCSRHPYPDPSSSPEEPCEQSSAVVGWSTRPQGPTRSPMSSSTMM